MLVYSPKFFRMQFYLSERTYFRRINLLKETDPIIQKNIDKITNKKNWDYQTYLMVKTAFEKFGVLE